MSWDAIFQKRKEITEVDDFIKDFYKKYKFELKNSKILDLGCGTGRHTLFFAEKGLEVFAQDKSKLALNILKEQIKKKYKIKIIESKIDEIPFPNQFFNVVVSTIVLHHGTIKQIKNWFKEILRVLKPDGFLVISVLSKNDVRYNTGEQIEKDTKINISDTFDPEIPHHFFTKEEILNFLKDFSILKTKETEKLSAKNYGKFKHWNIIARFSKN
jgi:ubiquinone/menaquinone biosynthesis C-methylase UbiE